MINGNINNNTSNNDQVSPWSSSKLLDYLLLRMKIHIYFGLKIAIGQHAFKSFRNWMVVMVMIVEASGSLSILSYLSITTRWMI